MADTDQVRVMLTETLTAVCRSSLAYRAKCTIQGSIQILLDDQHHIKISFDKVLTKDSSQDVLSRSSSTMKRKSVSGLSLERVQKKGKRVGDKKKITWESGNNGLNAPTFSPKKQTSLCEYSLEASHQNGGTSSKSNKSSQENDSQDLRELSCKKEYDSDIEIVGEEMCEFQEVKTCPSQGVKQTIPNLPRQMKKLKEKAEKKVDRLQGNEKSKELSPTQTNAVEINEEQTCNELVLKIKGTNSGASEKLRNIASPIGYEICSKRAANISLKSTPQNTTKVRSVECPKGNVIGYATPSNSSFLCHICGKTLESNAAHQRHLVRHEAKKFMCNTCGMMFYTAGVLKAHTTIHTGEKPFVCSFCGQKFRTKSNYVFHKMKHTGEKPYKCEFCDRRFRQLVGKREHEYTHTQLKPYKCQLCGKGFNHKTEQKRCENAHKGIKRTRNSKNAGKVKNETVEAGSPSALTKDAEAIDD